MNQTRTLSTLSITLALSLMAGQARADQPVVADATQAQIDQELAEMAAIAAARFAPRPAAPVIETPTIAQPAAPVVPVAAPAADSPTVNGSMLGDTIAQLVPSLLKRRQATVSPDRSKVAPAERTPANLSRDLVLTAGGEAFIDATGNPDKAIVIPPRDETAGVSTDVYGLNQRWKQQDQSAAESRARHAQPAGDQPLFASQDVSSLPMVKIDHAAVADNDGNGSWRTLAEPGQNHQLLDIFAGTWQVEGRFETQPGQPPEVAKGTMTSTWQLGQRWLRQEYAGSMPSLGAFEGIGFFGFDNARGQFVTTWMDTLSTTAMTSHGTFNEMAGTFTFTGPFTAAGGATFTQKQVLTVQSRDRYSIALSLIGPDQSETPTGTVTYTRSGGMRTFTNEGGSSPRP